MAFATFGDGPWVQRSAPSSPNSTTVLALVPLGLGALAFLRLPIWDRVRVVRSDHVEGAFPFPRMQEPAHVVLLEELAIGVVVVPECGVLRRPNILASLVKNVEFPGPLGLERHRCQSDEIRPLWVVAALTSEITSGTGV